MKQEGSRDAYQKERSVIFREENEGGRAMGMMDEERVRREG